MSLLSKLFGRERRGAGRPFDDIALPWASERTSIYEHIRAHLAPVGLTPGGEVLPDEERFGDDRLRWVAGGMDGAWSHHGGGGADADTAERVHDALAGFVAKPTTESFAALYTLLLTQSAIDLVDGVNERIVDGPIPADRLYQVARFLAAHAPDREPVKLAIAWLGLVRGGEEDDLLETLGRHEELTLYASISLANRLDAPDRTLFALARHVEGWGRVHLVERLAASDDPEIRRWLVRGGFRNRIMNEYTVLFAARGGRLLAELSDPAPDADLLAAAGEILSALIDGIGGPVDGMDAYEDGPAATERYLELIAERAERLEDLNAVATIRSFLAETGDQEGDEAWADRAVHGWTAELRSRLRERAEGIIAWPAWRERTEQALKSADPAEFGAAVRAAQTLGIDAWEEHFRRAEAGELGTWHWGQIARTDDPERFERVLDLADRRLSPERIGTGPSDELGFGPEFAEHATVEQIVQGLPGHPGRGTRWLLACLRSPVVRQRHKALGALEAWERTAWPPGVEAALDRALLDEPDDALRERIGQLVAADGAAIVN